MNINERDIVYGKDDLKIPNVKVIGKYLTNIKKDVII